MNTIRWIIFLPVTYAVIYVVHLVTTWAFDITVWWVAPIVYTLMIIPIGLSGFMSSLVAPDRKVGGYVFIGLLVVVEFFNIREAIADWPIHLIIWRVVVDGFMVHGALTAASSPKDFKDIKLEA